MKAINSHRLLLAAVLATVLAGCAAVREDAPAAQDPVQAQDQAQAQIQYSVPF
jgi:uncharacterized lipoprotein